MNYSPTADTPPTNGQRTEIEVLKRRIHLGRERRDAQRWESGLEHAARRHSRGLPATLLAGGPGRGPRLAGGDARPRRAARLATENAILRMDIKGRRPLRCGLDTGALRQQQLPERICWIAERTSGGLMAGLDSGVAFLSNQRDVAIVHRGTPSLLYYFIARGTAEHRLGAGRASLRRRHGVVSGGGGVSRTKTVCQPPPHNHRFTLTLARNGQMVGIAYKSSLVRPKAWQAAINKPLCGPQGPIPCKPGMFVAGRRRPHADQRDLIHTDTPTRRFPGRLAGRPDIALECVRHTEHYAAHGGHAFKGELTTRTRNTELVFTFVCSPRTRNFRMNA